MNRNYLWKTLLLLAVLPALSLAAASADSKDKSPAKKFTAASWFSTPTPWIRSAEGSVLKLDLKSQRPTLKISSKQGDIWIRLKHSTKVWDKNKSFDLNQLKVGMRVKVRYTAKHGDQIAKSIEMLHE